MEGRKMSESKDALIGVPVMSALVNTCEFCSALTPPEIVSFSKGNVIMA